MTAMWLLFLLLHVIGLSGYNLLLKSSSLARMDRWTLATIMQTGITVPIVFTLPFRPPDPAAFSAWSVALVPIVASLVIALHITNVKALQYLEASVYSVLYNLRIIFTTILGVIFFSEAMVPLQIAGGLLIFLAVLTVRQKGKVGLTRRGIEWGVAAGVVISLLNLAEKELINLVGFFNYAAPVMVTAAIVMWAVLLAQKKTISIAVFTHPRVIALMVFRGLSAFGFTLAFYYGSELGVSSYISSLSVVVIVVCGIMFLGEKDFLKQKLVATALAVLGLTCILAAQLIA